MKKIEELRAMAKDALEQELLASAREQFNLRFQSGTESTQSHHIKEVRRYIARIKTILSEKQYATKR